MNLTKPNKKPGDLTPITPNVIVGDIIGVIPLPKIIGLNITQNGGSEFHFNTVEDINITSIDVRGISKSFTVINNVVILGETWEELNNYTFSVSEIKKKWVNSIGKWQHTVVIKMIDSPYISCNLDYNPLYLRFYIYYTLDGENKRIIADTEYPEKNIDKGEHLKYVSNTYKNRAFWPYSLQLDSIYRPFFFNSALLFFDGRVIPNGDADKTYAKFYFSIANGCTLRDDTPFRDYSGNTTDPMYRIGDINLTISNLNKQGVQDVNSIYNFTIKDNFRIFSEIEDFHVLDNERFKDIERRKNLLKDAHIMGIRESGSLDTLGEYSRISDKENNSEIISGSGISHHCGILLPNMGENKVLFPFHRYESGLTPTNIEYYNKKVVGGKREKIDVYNISSATSFNTTQPLNVSFTINDASPNINEHKTIEVKCDDIRFPVINKNDNNKITIPYTSYTDDITFITLSDNDKDDFFTVLGRLNVGDYKENNIFDYLYGLSASNKITFTDIDLTGNTKTSKST